MPEAGLEELPRGMKRDAGQGRATYTTCAGEGEEQKATKELGVTWSPAKGDGWEGPT